MRKVFWCSFCTRLTDSSPPPMTTSMPSCMIWWAAMPMAIIPDEHCRSTVIPGTCTGMPAASALQRPTL